MYLLRLYVRNRFDLLLVQRPKQREARSDQPSSIDMGNVQQYIQLQYIQLP